MKTKFPILVSILLLAAAFTCNAQTLSPDITKNHKPTFGGGPRAVEIITVNLNSANSANVEYYGVEDATLFVVDKDMNVIDCRNVYEGEFDKIKLSKTEGDCRLIAVSPEGEMTEWKIQTN